MAAAASPYIRHLICADACQVELEMPEAIRVLFPDRMRRARRSMERAAACHGGEGLHTAGGVLRVVLPLAGEEGCPPGEALVNRLVRQCHAPVLPHVAARRLKIGAETLKALGARGLAPSLQVPAFRHGRRYTLRAFSLSDMEALARHLANDSATGGVRPGDSKE